MSKNDQPMNTGLTRARFLELAVGAAGAGAMGLGGMGLPRAQTAMLKRAVPNTGEEVPVIGLGTAVRYSRGREPKNFATGKAVITTLLDGGGTVIDTSPTYGYAQEIIGRALAEMGRRNEAFIATKISIYGEEDGIEQYRQSVKDLQTPVFDLLQVHNLKDTKAHLRTIRRLKEEGKVRYAGVTIFIDSQNDELAQVIETEPLDFIQCQYSIINRSTEHRILPLAREKGIAVMVNVPFARGAAFLAVRGQPVPAWAAEFNAFTWGQFFLKFILANEAVTTVIPGTSKVHHMADNLKAGFGRLPGAAERQRMLNYLAEL